MPDAKKYANFSGFRYSPSSCWGRVYGEGKTHPGKVYHFVEVYLPLVCMDFSIKEIIAECHKGLSNYGYHFEFVPAVSSVKCIYLVQTQKYTYNVFVTQRSTVSQIESEEFLGGTYWNMLGPKRHKSTRGTEANTTGFSGFDSTNYCLKVLVEAYDLVLHLNNRSCFRDKISTTSTLALHFIF